MPKESVRERYYAFAVLAACCFILGLVMGMGTNCNGVFMQPVSKELDVGIGDVSGYVTLLGIAYALFSPVVGRLINRVDIRKIMSTGAFVTTLGFMLLSVTKSLWQFYLGGMIVGIGVSMCAFLSTTVIINNWFFKSIGLVTGIMMSASSLVGIIMNPMLNVVISDFGWRSAYRLIGALILLVQPVIWGVISMYPSQKNALRWGSAPESAPSGKPEGKKEISFGQMLKYKHFLLTIGFVFCSSFTVNHLNHFQSVATSNGFTPAVGAAMISFGMAGEFIGKMSIGYLSDRLGIFKAGCIVAFSALCGVTGLFFISGQPEIFPMLCALAYGPVVAMGSVGYSLIARNMFGKELYPLFYPYMGMTSTLAFSIGFPLIGYIYDGCGSYAPTYFMAYIGIGIAFTLLYAALKAAEKYKSVQK